MAINATLRILLMATLAVFFTACESDFGGSGGVDSQKKFSSGGGNADANDPSGLDPDSQGDNPNGNTDGADGADGADAGGFDSGEDAGPGTLGMDGDGGDGGIDGSGSEGDNGTSLDTIDESIDSDCRYFLSDEELDEAGYTEADIKHQIDGGPPLDIDVRNYTQGGSGKLEDGDYVFKFKAYIVNGTYYDNLDKTPRNSDFTSKRFDAVIKDARSPGCEIVARHENDTTNTREGCFLETTKIKLANGTVKMAKEIQRGDRVWNPVLRKGVEVSEIVRGLEKEAGVFEVGVQGKTVVVTSTHPFLTKAGVKQAQELTKVDMLIGEDGNFHKISHLKQRPLDPTVKVANLVLGAKTGSAAQHMVLADGVVSGDLHLQMETERQRKFDRLNQRLSRIVK